MVHHNVKIFGSVNQAGEPRVECCPPALGAFEPARSRAKAGGGRVNGERLAVVRHAELVPFEVIFREALGAECRPGRFGLRHLLDDPGIVIPQTGVKPNPVDREVRSQVDDYVLPKPFAYAWKPEGILDETALGSGFGIAVKGQNNAFQLGIQIAILLARSDSTIRKVEAPGKVPGGFDPDGLDGPPAVVDEGVDADTFGCLGDSHGVDWLTVLVENDVVGRVFPQG